MVANTKKKTKTLQKKTTKSTNEKTPNNNKKTTTNTNITNQPTQTKINKKTIQ